MFEYSNEKWVEIFWVSGWILVFVGVRWFSMVEFVRFEYYSNWMRLDILVEYG